MSVISVQHVSKRFGGLQALSDVSFEVPEGKIFGLIGPNGAGKTTMFNVINGIFPPEQGRITVRGRDVTGMASYKMVPLGIGRTFQLMRPFGKLTVHENLMAAAYSRTRSERAANEIAQAVAERSGMTRYLQTRSDGLPTAGKKRLELARALALGADVLLLDEVLAGLVPSERQPIIELLADLRSEGLTILMVEHVMAAVMQLCDEVVVLNHGSVLARGTPQAVTQDPRVIEAYLGADHAAH